MSITRPEEKKFYLDPMLLYDKKNKQMNSYKTQKMLKKKGVKDKLDEIKKMLGQIKDQKHRDKKSKANISQKEIKKDLETENVEFFTRRNSHQIPRFSLRNIQNLAIQEEELEKNLEIDEFDSKKNSAAQTIDQARNFLSNKRPGLFDYRFLITEPHDDDNPANIFKEMKSSFIII